MKLTSILVSTLACVLTFHSAYSMNDNNNNNNEQPSVKQTIGSYIKLKSFFLELAAICSDDEIERKDLLKLGKYVKWDKIAKLFSLDPATVKKFFHTKRLKKLVKLITVEDEEDATPEKKAKNLKKAFKINAWQEELGCQNLEPVVEHLIDLFYFSGTDEDKKDLLLALKNEIPQLTPENEESTIHEYFDLEKLSIIIDNLFADKEVTTQEVLGVIKKEATDKLPQVIALQKYAHLPQLILCITVLLRADNNAITPTELFQCVRWDTLVCVLPELLGADAESLQTLFHVDRLQKQLALLQDGKEVSGESIRETINQEALQPYGITLENICNYIYFDDLAHSLNNLRKGIKADISEAFHIPLLQSLLETDIINAFDANNSEEVQYGAVSEVVNQLTDSTWFTHCKNGLPFLVAPIVIWSFGHTFCHEFMELLEPNGWNTGAPILLGTLYLTYTSMQFFKKTTPLKVIAFNTFLVKGSRMLNSFLGYEQTDREKLLTHVKENNRELVSTFLQLLSDEQLNTLEKPVYILILFSTPRKFIAKQTKFMKSICTFDEERTSQIIGVIVAQLEKASPLNTLPHVKVFHTFVDNLDEKIYKLLPHPDLLDIAQYRPQFLLIQTKFLSKAATYSLDKAVDENGTNLIQIFLAAVEMSNELALKDLED